MKLDKRYFYTFAALGLLLFVFLSISLDTSLFQKYSTSEALIIQFFYAEWACLMIPWLVFQVPIYLEKKWPWGDAISKKRVIVEVGISSIIVVLCVLFMSLSAYLWFDKRPFISVFEIKLSLLMNLLLLVCFESYSFYQRANGSKKKSQLPKYQTSSLTLQDIEEHLKKINHLMDKEKPYLDAELNSTAFAEKVNIPKHHMSQILNDELKQNFFDFINSYRIDYAKHVMQSSSEKNIAEIMYASGFNSKSSFNTAFKKHTGISPSAFRKKLK